MWPFKGNPAFLPRRVKEERNNGIPADVACNILLGIVCAHLFLVNVFLENISEDIGIDLLIVAQRAVIVMPVEFIEKGKELLKGSIGDGYFAFVSLLYLVFLEKPAVQIRHAA